MKKLALLALLTGGLSTHAADEIKAASSTTFSPTTAVLCMYEAINIDDRLCASLMSVAPWMSTTASVLLLKDLEAAQPDAIAYLKDDEQDPSLLLQEVVGRLQELTFEATDREITFDEAAQDIALNI